MDVKDDLKNIISEHLAKVASSFFINKSLAIMDESADNKESFLAASDRVSKRIALFIDTDLAKKVFDVLKAEIGKRELEPGTRRKYLRVTFPNRIYVTYNRVSHELYTENISEGGMYIKTKEPFPAGSDVEILLPLEAGSQVRLKGTVASSKSPDGDMFGHPPGMGIEFKEVGDVERQTLRDFVKRISTLDIPEDQKESMIKPPFANNRKTVS